MTTSAAIEVRPASSPADRDAFVELPYELYAGDPHFVPPLRVAERERLDPAKNPFFAHAEAQLYLARRGGRVVGRIAAIDDALHRQAHQEEVGFFGFFEARDEEAARALLEAAERWARDRGRSEIRGPVNPSLNDAGGVLVDGFDRDPALMMPYNPPAYPGWIEAAGYAKAKDLWAWWFDDPTKGINERTARILERIRRSLDPLPTIRPMSRRGYWEDAETMRQLFCAAWKDNWGFVPPTEAEFQHAAKEMRPILDRRLALLMELEGRPIAFSLTVQDVHQILKGMGGRLTPVGMFKLAFRRWFTDRGRMMLLGVLPEYRGKGLELMLIAHSIHYSGGTLGWRGSECSWTLEDNVGINKAISLVGGEHYKTYRIYDKSL